MHYNYPDTTHWAILWWATVHVMNSYKTAARANLATRTDGGNDRKAWAPSAPKPNILQKLGLRVPTCVALKGSETDAYYPPSKEARPVREQLKPKGSCPRVSELQTAEAEQSAPCQKNNQKPWPGTWPLPVLKSSKSFSGSHEKVTFLSLMAFSFPAYGRVYTGM